GKESSGNGAKAVGVVQSQVEIAGDSSRWANFEHRLDAGNPDRRDVDRSSDGRARHGVVVDTRRAPLMVGREFGHDPLRETVSKADFEEVVAFGQGRLRHYSLLRH